MTKDTEKVRAIQTFLWVVMILSQMMVVKCLEIHAKTVSDTEVIIYSRTMRDQDGCVQPEEFYVEDGIRYELSDWSVVPATLPSVAKKVEQNVVYERVEGVMELPEQILVTAQDNERGQTVQAAGQIYEKERLKEEWQEGFFLPVTFHNYQADYYQLADSLIPHDGERPRLDGCEGYLLELAEISPKEYTIKEIRWVGDAYEDSDGTWCRDAEASGQMLVRDYRVTYVGTAVFPEQKGWQTVAVYRQKPEESTASTKAHPQPIILPKTAEEPRKPILSGLWERITKILLITIAIGAVLFFGGLFLLLLLRMVKKVRACYNRRKNKTDGGTSYVHRK